MYRAFSSTRAIALATLGGTGVVVGESGSIASAVDAASAKTMQAIPTNLNTKPIRSSSLRAAAVYPGRWPGCRTGAGQGRGGLGWRASLAWLVENCWFSCRRADRGTREEDRISVLRSLER